MPETMVATTLACAATKLLSGPKAVRTIGGDERDHDGGGDQGAHDAADGLADPLCSRVVPSTAPALKSFMTSPARPHATATMPAIKNSLT